MDIADLRIDGQVEAELLWFFNEASGDMGLSSNFMPMVARLQCPRDAAAVTSYEADYRQVHAASRDKAIRRALELVGAGNESVLCAAYTDPVAKGLEPLGRLAGVVLRLPATQQAHAQSKTDKPLDQWLGKMAKPSAKPSARATCQGFVREAEELLHRAASAYRRVRGKTHR